MRYNDFYWQIPQLNFNQTPVLNDNYLFWLGKKQFRFTKNNKKIFLQSCISFFLIPFFVNINRKHILHIDNLISFSYTSRRSNLNLHLKKEKKRREKTKLKDMHMCRRLQTEVTLKAEKSREKKKSSKHITIEK